MQLQVKVVSEDPLVPEGGLLGFFAAALQDMLRNLASQAGRQGDQALGVLFEQFFVDARLVVEALGMALRDELDEVAVARAVLGKEDQVVVCLAVLGRGLLEAGSRSDVGLATDQGLDTRFLGLAVELDGPVHHAVIGEGERRHLVFGRTLDQFADAARAVEERVLGVDVAVNELRLGQGSSPSRPLKGTRSHLSIARIGLRSPKARASGGMPSKEIQPPSHSDEG
ncbi:hypothetical protein D3C87_1041910 [compost metagenome]